MTAPNWPRRILILDNAISNGGDAAILLAMQASLQALYGMDVEIRVCFCGATVEPGIFQTLYPEIHFVRTLWHAEEATWGRNIRWWDRLLRRSLAARFNGQARLLRLGLPRMLLRVGEYALLREYQEADVIVVSGGGFLNTSWTPLHLRQLRVAQYRAALNLGRPLVFYAQSIGPFTPNDSLPALLRPILQQAKLVLCRSALSAQIASDLLGGLQPHVHITMDEALLLSPRPPSRLLAPARRRSHRIGICPHQWHWQNAPAAILLQQEFEARMAAVCADLIANGDCEIVFLTTHQGLEGLHRDDVVSQRIREQLPAHLQQHAHLVEGFVDPREIAGFWGTCDVTLSSRLHGALLSLIGGTPAVALTYEPKTSQLMQSLGLEDWVFSMWDIDVPNLLACLYAILNDLPDARRRQTSAVAQGQKLALRNRALLHAALSQRGMQQDLSDVSPREPAKG